MTDDQLLDLTYACILAHKGEEGRKILRGGDFTSILRLMNDSLLHADAKGQLTDDQKALLNTYTGVSFVPTVEV